MVSVAQLQHKTDRNEAKAWNLGL